MTPPGHKAVPLSVKDFVSALERAAGGTRLVNGRRQDIKEAEGDKGRSLLYKAKAGKDAGRVAHNCEQAERDERMDLYDDQILEGVAQRPMACGDCWSHSAPC